MRTIFCNKLGKEAESLVKPPFAGEIGQKIYNEISKEAWQQWLNHQTMLINEYRLNMMDLKARSFLREEMQKFLFGLGSECPPDYNPQSIK